MRYTFSELTFFFFLYSFLGWCMEVAVLSVRRQKFIDPGLLSGPICPQYGVTMDLLLVFFPSLKGNYLIQFLACVAVSNIVDALAARLAEKTTGRRMWDIEKRAVFSSLPGFAYSLTCGLLSVLALAFVQPLAFILAHLLGTRVRLILNIALLVIFAADLFTVGFALRGDRKAGRAQETFARTLRSTANSFGERLSAHIHIRLENAYPPVMDIGGHAQERKTFAKGVTLAKLFWVFLICALLGDLIETVFVRCVSHIWMSRSSVLYGPFSIVWGLGAVVLTVVLTPLAQKGDRYVFLGGFLLGGTYEYMCSVFTEIVFGKVFWDYSNMPLNIGGRTNVLYMFFWGVLSVVWIQILYPHLSSLIEKIPVLAGTILTWVLAALMIVNALLSGLAIARYTARQEGTAKDTAIGEFLDDAYPDSLVEWVWPNMRESKKV